MKTILIIIALMILLTGCSDDFPNIGNDIKKSNTFNIIKINSYTPRYETRTIYKYTVSNNDLIFIFYSSEKFNFGDKVTLTIGEIK